MWLNLKSVESALREHGNVLPLPMMPKRKARSIDGCDDATGLSNRDRDGSGHLPVRGAKALRVPRNRFAPVKTTNDLLRISSDLYALGDDYQVLPRVDNAGDVVVDLDPKFYKSVADFHFRFAKGVPSLIGARRLTVREGCAFRTGSGGHRRCLSSR